MSKAALRSLLFGALALSIAGCGLGPLAQLHPTGEVPVVLGQSALEPTLLPDYQTVLTKGDDGKPNGSWYDVKGVQAGVNQDAQDINKLIGGDPKLYDYLTKYHGSVVVMVGGLFDEKVLWTKPMPYLSGMPVLVMNYALDPYTGPGKKFWWPMDRTYHSSLLPYDAIKGMVNYQNSVDYGTYLLDRVISKLEAAGSGKVHIYGHSKGADVSATALLSPELKFDRTGDKKVATMYTFAMPIISKWTPAHWGFKSQAKHWGGFFKKLDGRLIIYNRDSDFCTYGGWIDLPSHDYSHLVWDSWLGAYDGKRGNSPAWSESDNFVTRMKDFATSDATSDQSPTTLSFDW